MITKSSVVEIQNIIVNSKSGAVKSNSEQYQQEMLHAFIHAFALATENSQILMFSRTTFKKGGNLVIILGFPRFLFWKKNLWTFFVLHNKET